jgi:hypothetical protein
VEVASDKLSVSEVQEKNVAVLVILHGQRPWQEPGRDVSVPAILRVPIASQELAKGVLVRENQHEEVVSGVWTAWEEETASWWSQVANVAHSCDGG